MNLHAADFMQVARSYQLFFINITRKTKSLQV